MCAFVGKNGLLEKWVTSPLPDRASQWKAKNILLEINDLHIYTILADLFEPASEIVKEPKHKWKTNINKSIKIKAREAM